MCCNGAVLQACTLRPSPPLLGVGVLGGAGNKIIAAVAGERVSTKRPHVACPVERRVPAQPWCPHRYFWQGDEACRCSGACLQTGGLWAYVAWGEEGSCPALRRGARQVASRVMEFGVAWCELAQAGATGDSAARAARQQRRRGFSSHHMPQHGRRSGESRGARAGGQSERARGRRQGRAWSSWAKRGGGTGRRGENRHSPPLPCTCPAFRRPLSPLH